MVTPVDLDSRAKLCAPTSRTAGERHTPEEALWGDMATGTPPKTHTKSAALKPAPPSPETATRVCPEVGPLEGASAYAERVGVYSKRRGVEVEREPG
jgi:hypothetical protein